MAKKLKQDNGGSQDTSQGQGAPSGQKNARRKQPATVTHPPSLSVTPMAAYQVWGFSNARFSIADQNLSQNLASLRFNLGSGEVIEIELKISQLATLERTIGKYLDTPEE